MYLNVYHLPKKWGMVKAQTQKRPRHKKSLVLKKREGSKNKMGLKGRRKKKYIYIYIKPEKQHA